jgi:glycosyltransferase involved in cell wall biosynthesis
MYLCHQFGLMDWLKSWNPQALIIEANPRYLGTGSGVRWMHQRKGLVVGWGLGAPVQNGFTGKIQREAWRRFIRQFDVMVTYSEQGREQYLEAGFIPERLFVAPNATTHRPSHPLPERPVEYKNRPCILFVGRLQSRKRIDILLRACAALPVDRQPTLTIVGDGPARNEFEALAHSIYALAEFVGAKHEDALEPYYQKADLFILPGTGGLAIQQAMAHGLPIIVAEADGTQQELVRSSNGWHVSPGDIAALTSTLEKALGDPERLRQMGAESYRIVCDEINIEMMVKVFLEALSVHI